MIPWLATEWIFCRFYPFCVPDSGEFVGFVATEWKWIAQYSFCGLIIELGWSYHWPASGFHPNHQHPRQHRNKDA